MKADVIERVIFNNQTFTRNSKHSGMYFRRKKYLGKFNGKKKYQEQLLHRVIWEYHNGPIPRDGIIHHIDGNPLNNAPENLECVPEYLHRKTKYHYHRRNKNTFIESVQRKGDTV